MAVASRAEVLVALGKGSTADDVTLGLVNMLVPMVTSQVQTFLGYELEVNTWTEYLPARNLILQVDPLDWARQPAMAA